MKAITILILTAVLLTNLHAKAQQANQNPLTLRQTITAIDTSRKYLAAEKLYLQTDKPDYITGDTLRFKAYLLNADFLTPATRSGLVYVELDDQNNKTVKRMMTQIINGLCWGEMALVLKNPIPDGNYTLRAYTNWQRNFGEDYVFKKNIYVLPALPGPALVKATFKATEINDKQQVSVTIDFTAITHKPLKLHPLQINVKEGVTVLYSTTASTDTLGRVLLNFIVNNKTAIKDLYIEAGEKRRFSEQEIPPPLVIPLTLNRAEKTDLQFMPEGGSLVAGIPTKIGFKAISEDGKATEVSGKIYDTEQHEISAFKSRHKGMGSFKFIPQRNETYTAKITQPNGSNTIYTLPDVKQSGTTLRVENKGPDSLLISVAETNVPNDTYYLTAQARGVVCYAERLILNSRQQRTIATSLFPTGVCHFTLFSPFHQPLNERIVFINHHDDLRVSISTDKPAYTLNDSVDMLIQVKDVNGRPVKGNFSLAVTDAAQVTADSLGGNITNNLLFTSDLKGNIEEPAYYFRDSSAQRNEELDNLMLTQGWVSYNWDKVFGKPTVPEFKPEPKYEVNGRVTNVFNKPIVKTKVNLLSTHPLLALTTLTDTAGRFSFTDFPPLNLINFKLQAFNSGDKNFNVKLHVNEFIRPEFLQKPLFKIPWYINTDTTATLALLKASEIANQKNTKQLKEVVVKGYVSPRLKKDVTLDEEELRNESKGKSPLTLYELYGKLIKLYATKILIVDNRYAPFSAADIEQWLQLYTVDDIIKINVTVIGTLGSGPPPMIMGVFGPVLPVPDKAYITITSKAHTGPYMGNTGEYSYRPMPISWPHEFYNPKYDVKNKVQPHFGPTIYWQPNITTNVLGKARVSFYGADRPASYNVIIEGISFNGDIGRFTSSIKVGDQL